MNPNDLKTVLITGASRGIGKATACLFAKRGWRILTLSSKPLDAGDTAPAHYLPLHIVVDLADSSAIAASIPAIVRRLPGGCLHALVNNAGVSPKLAGGQRMSIKDTDMKTLRHVFDINFFSAAQLTKALLLPLQNAGGAVVNVSSIAANLVHPFAGMAYSTSKAALLALTREMAHEFGSQGVRVNAITPGEIDTDILSPDTLSIVSKCVPLRRLGSPEEVAEVIYFLCSDASAYMNGSEIPIDGGQRGCAFG